MHHYLIQVIALIITTFVVITAMYHQHQDIARENYITLAAHFTADQLYKAHRLQVNELLGVPVIQV